MHKCLSCGKPITWNFAICADCEKIHGNSAKEWPEWLRFLWNSTQRERRSRAKQLIHEVPLVDDTELEFD